MRELDKRILKLVKNLSECKLFEELPQEERDESDAGYNWMEKCWADMDDFVKSARALMADQPVTEGITITFTEDERERIESALFRDLARIKKISLSNELPGKAANALGEERLFLERIRKRFMS